MIEYEYQLKNSRRLFENQKILFKENFVSENDYLSAKDNYEFLLKKYEWTIQSQKVDSTFRTQQINQLETSIQRMAVNLEVVKSKLNDLILKAPINGQLTTLNADIGQNKVQGTRLGQIDDLNEFKIVASID